MMAYVLDECRARSFSNDVEEKLERPVEKNPRIALS